MTDLGELIAQYRIAALNGSLFNGGDNVAKAREILDTYKNAVHKGHRLAPEDFRVFWFILPFDGKEFGRKIDDIRMEDKSFLEDLWLYT